MAQTISKIKGCEEKVKTQPVSLAELDALFATLQDRVFRGEL
jgi:hypothetical protein